MDPPRTRPAPNGQDFAARAEGERMVLERQWAGRPRSSARCGRRTPAAEVVPRPPRGAARRSGPRAWRTAARRVAARHRAGATRRAAVRRAGAAGARGSDAARRRRRHKIPSAAQGARRREVDGGGRSSFEGDRRDIRREELEAARDATGHRPVRRPVPPPLEQGLAAGPQQGAVGGRVETNRRVSFANAVTETTARRRREAPGI